MKLNRRPGARQRGVPPGHPGRRHEHPPTPRKNVSPRRQIPDALRARFPRCRQNSPLRRKNCRLRQKSFPPRHRNIQPRHKNLFTRRLRLLSYQKNSRWTRRYFLWRQRRIYSHDKRCLQRDERFLLHGKKFLRACRQVFSLRRRFLSRPPGDLSCDKNFKNPSTAPRGKSRNPVLARVLRMSR